jgi:beta-lactamase regulating signal transducer with metallopeptidase domain
MDTLIRWLLTYLLHSTVLLGGAWLVGRALGERRLVLQEALLRAALIGGFLTAGLQIGLELRPAAGHLGLLAPAPASAPNPVVAAPAELGVTAALPPATITTAPQTEALPAVRLRNLGAAAAWAFFAAWLAIASAMLARLLVGAWRLRRLLRGRRPLPDAERAADVQAAAFRLGLRPPVRCATAPALAIPLTTGILRPEICLPARVFDELSDDARLALCAHEMAHVVRRDPAWLLAARLVETAAPLQPLNHWARRRLEDLAECLSDDLAVRACDQPLGLARSLLDVASWTLTRGVLLPATAVGAFRARSRLAYRVERIMDPARRLERPQRFLLPGAAVLVLATSLLLPVVSRGAVADVPPEPSVDAAPAPMPAEAAQPAAAPAPRPALAPKAPKPPKPPKPAKGSHSADIEKQLEALNQKIEARMKGRESELSALNEKIAAAMERSVPNEKEIDRLSQQIAEAASQMAALAAQGGTDAQQASARAEMDQARKQLQEAMKQIRVPTEAIKELQAQAKAIADAVRPTAEEMAELKRLSKELALESMPDAQEMARMAREAGEQAREAMKSAQKEMERARLEAQRATEDAQRAARDIERERRESERSQSTPPSPEDASE